MPKKDTDDPDLFAKSDLDQIIAKHDPEAVAETGKDPKKVASGLRGGAKGGHARAKKLSAKKGSAIAKKAIATRWKRRVRQISSVQSLLHSLL